MPENNKRKWVIASVAAALGVVLLIVLAERGPAPQVQIVSVTREDLTASITGNGKVEPISPDGGARAISHVCRGSEGHRRAVRAQRAADFVAWMPRMFARSSRKRVRICWQRKRICATHTPAGLPTK